MAWISGRTVSPASGELVFMIDDNAMLPPPQNWDQLWQICKGIEPIIARAGGNPPIAIDRPSYCDRALQATPNYDNLIITLSPSEYLKAVPRAAVRHRSFNDSDADPYSLCESYTRTLTVSIVNFEINDDGDSVLETTGCVDFGRSCDSISIYLKTRGRNPSRATLQNYFPDGILRAICWHESRWRHFLPNGTPVVNKNSNGTADWGLMQINQATFEQRWNWKSNLGRGVALLGEKRTHAMVYLQRQRCFHQESHGRQALVAGCATETERQAAQASN
jgi:hypothetical protein